MRRRVWQHDLGGSDSQTAQTVSGGNRTMIGKLVAVAGLMLTLYAAVSLIGGVWLEHRDRNRYAAELIRTAPLLAIPDPRKRMGASPGHVIAMPVRKAPTAAGLGIVKIERLGLSVLIREGATPADLDKGAGWISGTAKPGEGGNVGIAGHRDTFFARLQDVRIGDRIVLLTPGKRTPYVVRETLVVGPTETNLLKETPWPALTLVTCYPFEFIGAAPQRFIVRALGAE